MGSAKPPPLAIPEERRATMRMIIELHQAIHGSIFYRDPAPNRLDANLDLIAAAVLLGHAEGNAMNASEIADLLHMKPNTVLARLNKLIKLGIIIRVGDDYYLELSRAINVPMLDRFIDVPARGFGVIGPFLERRKPPLPRSEVLPAFERLWLDLSDDERTLLREMGRVYLAAPQPVRDVMRFYSNAPTDARQRMMQIIVGETEFRN